MKKSKNLRKKQIEAIKQLVEYDHCFINEEGVKRFTEPFGFVGSTYEAEDSRNEIKGLSLDTGPGTTLKGQDACIVAEEIAKKVCGFRPWQEGRGSRLRTACKVVLEHLEKESGGVT